MLFFHIPANKNNRLRRVSPGTLFSFIRLTASHIASQFYYAAHSFIVFRTALVANKIALKPQGFNKTFGLPKIKLCTQYGIKLEKLIFSLHINIEVIYLSDSILREKAKAFAKDIVYLCREIKSERRETVLVNQLLRSATSIGANLHEAQYAQSTNDFISKFEIAQKECYETEYWLELLFATESIDETKYKKLQNDCGAIRRMLISSLKTIKSK